MELKMGARYNVDWVVNEGKPSKIQVLGTLTYDGAEAMYPDFIAANRSKIDRSHTIFIVRAVDGEAAFCTAEPLINDVEEEMVEIYARVLIGKYKSSDVSDEFVTNLSDDLNGYLYNWSPEATVVGAWIDGNERVTDPIKEGQTSEQQPADEPKEDIEESNRELMSLCQLTGALPNEIKRSKQHWNVRGRLYRFSVVMSRNPEETLVQKVDGKYLYEIADKSQPETTVAEGQEGEVTNEQSE